MDKQSQFDDKWLLSLLGREEVSIDDESLRAMLTDQVVLVTGAAGSVGVELCRQIAAFAPKLMVLVDYSEYLMYELDLLFRKEFPNVSYVPFIGNIRDAGRMDRVFGQYRPDVVFHGAAYKHVPMMEWNPLEAIGTNAYGTKVLAEAAVRYGVKRFVQMSTDKVVNPTNVMGASKRVGEIVCQQMEGKSETKFMTVRFGNVMGSSGSVIPLFQRQISRGGPVTVTHREIKRFFMTMPEAARLVLQAGAMGDGGEIFVLDMGEQISITYLAERLIEQAGLEAGKDVEIVYTGLRPGEKLYEELLLDGEATLETSHPRVQVAKARPVDSDFDAKLGALLGLGIDSSREVVRAELMKVVPEYTPETHNKA